jgi:dipeptidyl aminopeptidase/acylaminoacyl peptidase
MKKIIICLLLGFIALFITPICLAEQADTIPLRDFFKNPEQGHFSISPDGKHLSMMKPWKSRMNVFTQEISSDRLPIGNQKQVTFVSDRDITEYDWKGNKTILYSRDFNGDENYHIFAVHIDSGKAIDLTPFPGVRADIVDDLKEVSETDILVQTNKRNPEIFDVYRLNTQTGELTLVAENPGKVTDWGTDHEGKVRISMEIEGLKTKISTRKSEAEPFKQILSFDLKSHFDPLFFSFDNQSLYGASDLNRDKSAIVKIDPNTGKELEIIYQRNDVDVKNLDYSRKRKVITAASYVTSRLERHFFDSMSEKRFNKIQQKLPDHEIGYAAYNKAEDLFVVIATNDKTRGRYYLYDDLNGRLTFLADLSPWLDPNKLASMKPIEYKSRDGLTIHGYLTLPKGKDPKGLPIVVNPHGGPWARDVWGYNSEVQFLANQGYAVFQMNFRGSTGYGKKFYVSSFRQWGRKMQDDITDGVEWLIAQGIADPKRVCIYGASYGGYAALAGIAFTPDLYACAVDYVGISNLLTFMNNIPPYWKVGLIQLKAMLGDPDKDQAMLRAASPVYYADQIKTPLFVAQGAKDPRVNIDESNQIVESLEKRGVKVEYMVKEDEGHGFHNEENRFDFYEAMERFLKKYL